MEHKQIGAMMDNFGLYERLSVYDNLSFYADIYRTSHGMIGDILKTFGLYRSPKNIRVKDFQRNEKPAVFGKSIDE